MDMTVSGASEQDSVCADGQSSSGACVSVADALAAVIAGIAAARALVALFLRGWSAVVAGVNADVRVRFDAAVGMKAPSMFGFAGGRWIGLGM